MYCSKCGNKLNPGDRFCGRCGAPVPQNSNHREDQPWNPSHSQNPNYDREQNVDLDGYYNQNSNYDREQNVNPDG
ncbi:MAG: zinc ribbon domain-containing protein, partial [Eubacterium sp.]|nr:zinc ribbon domain-containing protein [Eubacterium sp.]